MEQELLNLIKDLSYPAIIVLFLIIFNRAGFWKLLADFLRGKINGNTDLTIREKLDEVANNHLHEVVEILKRIEMGISADHRRMEDKMERLLNEITYLKAKANGK